MGKWNERVRTGVPVQGRLEQLTPPGRICEFHLLNHAPLMDSTVALVISGVKDGRYAGRV